MLQILTTLPTLSAYALGTGLLSLLGVELQLVAAASLGAGDFVGGGWFLLMGGVALYVGLYDLGYRRLGPRVRDLLGSGS